MKINISISKLLGAYKLINEAPLYNVTNKLSVLKVLRALKPHVNAYEEMKSDTEEKLKPKNWDELVEKYKSGDKASLGDYLQDVSNCLKCELDKEISIECDPLTEETICELCTENTKAGILVELMEIFC